MLSKRRTIRPLALASVTPPSSAETVAVLSLERTSDPMEKA